MKPPLQKNENIPLEITAITSQGSGVGHYRGFAVFAENTAVGDRILAHVIKVKSSYAIATVEKLLQPSKTRTAPVCPVYTRCGGCSFQHITYDAEKELKRLRVQDAMQRIGGFDLTVDEILTTGAASRYRNKAQYPVALGTDGLTRIGFYAKRSHRIVDCRDCALQPEEFAPILDEIARWAAEFGVTIYDETTAQGLLRHVYLRKAFATGEVMVCLVTASRFLPHTDALCARLTQRLPQIKSIIQNVNDAQTNVVLGQTCVTLWGTDTIEDELCELRFRISPLSFYQVNPRGAEILYRKAADFAALTGKELLLDLYCGTGTIGLSMAKNAAAVIGVEVIPQAIENAKENARLNNIRNATFYCDDASGAAARLLAERRKPDVVVLDPPRKGCALDVIETVAAMQPQRVVYVSCDAATLARDCKHFAALGYVPQKIVAVDMFPRTVHVETVVLLVRKSPDLYIDFKIDLDESNLTAAETKPTYEDIKAYVLKTYGLKVSTLYISQVKRKLGLEVGEAYSKPKSEKYKTPQCPEEKERAIVAALKHFKTI